MIGFKLRVMRLNRVESFYVFLIHFCSKRNEKKGGWPRPGPLQGRSAMAKPLVGVGQPYGQGYHLQGWPLVGATASRGSTRARRCYPGKAMPPAREVPPEDSHRLRRGSRGGVEGARGVRASFLKKDDPVPMNSKNFEDCPLI
ncbi:hypothetical protein BHE74_00017409 [Ensete ventricosum]|nr:hypothetical protein BHE74_00017409 [Ensete ventricosum]